MAKEIDMSIIGQRFGKLTVVEYIGLFKRNEKSRDNLAKFKCVCDCGKDKEVFKQELVSERTTTCGDFECWKKDAPNEDEILDNQKFGMLTVIRFLHFKDTKSKRVQILECLCDCGKIKNIRRDALITGNTKSCGCQLNLSYNSIDYAISMEYAKYKAGAKTRNINFLLSKEYFKKLLLDNCYYCGIEPKRKSAKSHLTTKKRKRILLNGIDRTNNKEGYTIQNCVPCCSQCNRAKMDYPYQEFLDWIKRVYEKQYQSG